MVADWPQAQLTKKMCWASCWHMRVGERNVWRLQSCWKSHERILFINNTNVHLCIQQFSTAIAALLCVRSSKMHTTASPLRVLHRAIDHISHTPLNYAWTQHPLGRLSRRHTWNSGQKPVCHSKTRKPHATPYTRPYLSNIHISVPLICLCPACFSYFGNEG